MKFITIKRNNFILVRITGEPYTGKLVRTVRGKVLGNLISRDIKAPSTHPTSQEFFYYFGYSVQPEIAIDSSISLIILIFELLKMILKNLL